MPDKIKNIISKSREFDSKDKDLIKKQGVVFTTVDVCNNIINNLSPKITDKICEPSVGKGVFVFCLLDYFRLKGHSIIKIADFVSNNLYCYDINDDFITIFKSLIIEYFNIMGYDGDLILDNIVVGDFLLSSNTYDITYGNPPYVRIQNLDDLYLNKLKELDISSVSKGNIDLYYAFVEKSLMCSNKIGFIIPNSFLKNKSGKSLRSILNNRLYQLYDYENNKVWNDISTYTCEIYCDSNQNTSFKYGTQNNTTLINKNNGDWFGVKSVGYINNIINNVSGGIATLRDKVYKFDYIDGDYVYRKSNGLKVEKNICKEVYKATTKDTYYFIYPYDEQNKIIGEQLFKQDYPLAYQYLLDNKSILQERDNGNLEKQIKYGNWYGYGRKQGMVKLVASNEVQFIIPLTFLKGKLHYKLTNGILVSSGISIVLDKKNVDKLIMLLESDNFQCYLEKTCKILHDNDITKKWLTITTTALKKY